MNIVCQTFLEIVQMKKVTVLILYLNAKIRFASR